MGVSEKDVLQQTSDIIGAQRDYRLSLHATWVVNDYFCRGLQNINDYDLYGGRVVLSGRDSGMPRWAGYNICRQVLNRSKAMLMQAPPRRDAKPTRGNHIAIEKARLHTVVMNDCYHRFNIEGEISPRVADAFIKTGNAVASFFLDTTKGEVLGKDENGRVLRAGVLTPRFDNPDRWIWDPRAQTISEIEYAVRITIQSVEKAVRMYPDSEEVLRRLETTITDDDFLENRLMNVTQNQRPMRQLNPKGAGCVVLFELYREPSEEFPQGLFAVMAGSSSTPKVVLRDFGMNPYGCIPAVLFAQDRSSYRLLGDTFLTDLIPLQREINRRAHQVLANSNLLGNPIMKYPLRGGSPPNTVTNAYGKILPYDPTEGQGPDYMSPPRMPAFVFQSQQFAMEMVGQIVPTSPADVTEAEATSSGIHAQMIAEARRSNVSQIIRNWEHGWDAFYKKYVYLWKRLTIHPMQLRAIGEDGAIAYEYVSGFDLGDDGDVEVSVVPYSAMPTSRTAAFAEWMELLKLGVGNQAIPLDPMVLRRMLDDIGKGDMTETWRDMSVDIKLADRIKAQVIMGQQVIPRIQDNPDLVLMKVMDFMKSEEYEMRLREDPMLEFRCTQAVAIFSLFKQQRDAGQLNAVLQRQMMMAQAQNPQPVQQGQAGAVQNSAAEMAPGAPRGGNEPQMTKGRSNAANTNQDQGGNPG